MQGGAVDAVGSTSKDSRLLALIHTADAFQTVHLGKWSATNYVCKAIAFVKVKVGNLRKELRFHHRPDRPAPARLHENRVLDTRTRVLGTGVEHTTQMKVPALDG